MMVMQSVELSDKNLVEMMVDLMEILKVVLKDDTKAVLKEMR